MTVENKHPRILIFNNYYSPGFRAGGPVRTLANMVDRLGGEFDFHIVTLDRDVGDTTPYPSVEVNTWTQHGKARVMYVPAAYLSLHLIAGIAEERAADVIYLNSFFDPIFTQRVLWARRFGLIAGAPIVLAPRGEFSEGALGLKRRKKQLYMRASRVIGLYKRLTWQASSELERSDILRILPYVRPSEIREAMDIAPVHDDKPFDRPVRRSDLPLRVCFLSRLSPKKNIDFALRALSLVKAQATFTVYGPIGHPKYWSSCEALAAALPSNLTVVYAGELHPNEVKGRLAQHDLFFFPTLGENYGHVIHEALGAGLPVLISDQTPWGDVVERGVGWVLPLDSEAEFARKIDDFAICEDFQVEAIKEAARKYAAEISAKRDVIEANRQLFTSVIDGAKG